MWAESPLHSTNDASRFEGATPRQKTSHESVAGSARRVNGMRAAMHDKLGRPTRPSPLRRHASRHLEDDGVAGRLCAFNALHRGVLRVSGRLSLSPALCAQLGIVISYRATHARTRARAHAHSAAQQLLVETSSYCFQHKTNPGWFYGTIGIEANRNCWRRTHTGSGARCVTRRKGARTGRLRTAGSKRSP